MTESSAALRDLAALLELMRRKPNLPETPACLGQAAGLFGKQEASHRPDDQVLERLRAELRQASATGALAALPAKTLRRAPMVFWDRDPQAAAFPGLMEHFLEGAAARPRWLRELVEAWLRDFGPDRRLLPEAGRAAAQLLARTSDPRLQPWHRAHHRYALFDAARGPERVGSALLAGTEPVDAVLSDVGMDDPIRAEGRFFRAAVKAMLTALPGALRAAGARDAWARAAAILEVQRTRRDRLGRDVVEPTLRVPDLAGETIAACLDPWLRDPPAPGAPREEIKAFLLRVVGDPRLRPEHWSGAPEACARLMRSWLAEASLETFFALISETNDDPQWRYRRAFWRACLRNMPRHRPAEVWVVLGPGMAARAKAVKDLANAHGRMALAAFGDGQQTTAGPRDVHDGVRVLNANEKELVAEPEGEVFEERWSKVHLEPDQAFLDLALQMQPRSLPAAGELLRCFVHLDPVHRLVWLLRPVRAPGGPAPPGPRRGWLPAGACGRWLRRRGWLPGHRRRP